MMPTWVWPAVQFAIGAGLYGSAKWVWRHRRSWAPEVRGGVEHHSSGETTWFVVVAWFEHCVRLEFQ